MNRFDLWKGHILHICTYKYACMCDMPTSLNENELLSGYVILFLLTHKL